MIRDSDYIQQLANYVKKNISKGYTQDSLKWALINQGHSRTEVEKAIKIANEQLAMQAPKMVEKPIIKVIPNPELEIKHAVVGESLFSKIKKKFRKL